MTPSDPFRTFLWLTPVALFIFACAWLFGHGTYHSRSRFEALFCALQHDPGMSRTERENVGMAHGTCHQLP
jgi:hypothetical protein